VDERGTRSEQPTGAEEGALGELLDTERVVEARLELARDEASRILEAAREHVRAIEEGFDAALDEAFSERRTILEEACEASRRAFEADAAKEAERYRALDAATVDDLARWVAARVSGGEAST
jgi:vacuolar-type H+-ATPase subunit H